MLFQNTNSENIIAAKYGRTSSDEQAERGTIQNQIDFGEKYCALHGINVIDEWYLDDGVTGTLPLEERPAGRRLIEDAKAGKFNLLLIYKLDRLGRTSRVILNAVYELEQYGVKVRSMNEPFDTSDPSGKFLLTVLAGVADLDRTTTLQRLWEGANRAAKEGKWLGGIVPFGYYKDEEGYLAISTTPLPGLDMTEASVIYMMYTLSADQRMSCVKIADYFNALGIPTSYIKDDRKINKGKRKEKTSGIWTPSRIRNMLVNPTYKGLHIYGKRTKKNRDEIERKVPAIVSENMWDRSISNLKEHQIEALRNAHRQYLLRGLIKCGTCGLNYSGTVYNGPKGQPKGYYVCNGKNAYRGPKQGKCTSKNVPQEWIEELVWNDIVYFITHPDETLLLLKKEITSKKDTVHTLGNESENIISAIKRKDTEKQSILDLYRKSLIDQSDVELQLSKITKETEVLRDRLNDLNSAIHTEVDIEHRLSDISNYLESLRDNIKEPLSWEDKRSIVKILVKKITVSTGTGENGDKPQLLIEYNFSQIDTHTVMDSSKRLHLPWWRIPPLPLTWSRSIFCLPGADGAIPEPRGKTPVIHQERERHDWLRAILPDVLFAPRRLFLLPLRYGGDCEKALPLSAYLCLLGVRPNYKAGLLPDSPQWLRGVIFLQMLWLKVSCPNPAARP